MDIRPATSRDAQEISTLIQGLAGCFTLHPDGEGAEAFLQTVSREGIDDLINAPSFRYLAGYIEGELAGVVAMRDNKHLFHLFVSPRFHRLGLAKKFWDHARDEALRAGNPGTFTVNSTPCAVPVYTAFGFEVVGPRVETQGIAFVPMALSVQKPVACAGGPQKVSPM